MKSVNLGTHSFATTLWYENRLAARADHDYMPWISLGERERNRFDQLASWEIDYLLHEKHHSLHGNSVFSYPQPPHQGCSLMVESSPNPVPSPAETAQAALLGSPPEARISEPVADPPPTWIYRHSLPVRVGHWINAMCLFILIMSGLQIFNAHPALYWGNRSDRNEALLSIRPMRMENGEIKGITTVFGHAFDTTGILGYSDQRGRAFPAWATLPGPQWLAMGRQWHLSFAWVFVITGGFFV